MLPTALIGGERRAGVIWALTEHDTAPSPGAARRRGLRRATVVYTVVAVRRREIALAVCGAGVLIWPFVLILGHVPDQ